MVEAVTWDYISRLITNPEDFEERLRQAQAKEAEAMHPKQQESEHMIALLNDTEKEADEIARASRKATGIVAAKLERQAEDVNKRYEALLRQKSELEEAAAVELIDQTVNDLLKFREVVAFGLENPTDENRRYWLDILQTTVTVTSGVAVITCRLGGNPLSYNLFEINKP